jgi:hypothetical protein
MSTLAKVIEKRETQNSERVITLVKVHIVPLQNISISPCAVLGKPRTASCASAAKGLAIGLKF